MARTLISDTATSVYFSTGGTDRVSLGDVTVGTTFSFCLWVYFNTVHQSGSTFQNLIRKDTPIIIDLNGNGKIEFSVSDGSYNAIFSTKSVWEIGAHHIVLTSERKIYVDGVLDNTGSAITPLSTSNTMTIGASSNSLLDKYVDCFANYNRAIDASEVSNIYNNNTYSTTGLLNFYRFNEGSGSTAYDDILTNNGTITGATYSGSFNKSVIGITSLTSSRTLAGARTLAGTRTLAS